MARPFPSFQVPGSTDGGCQRVLWPHGCTIRLVCTLGFMRRKKKNSVIVAFWSIEESGICVCRYAYKGSCSRRWPAPLETAISCYSAATSGATQCSDPVALYSVLTLRPTEAKGPLCMPRPPRLAVMFPCTTGAIPCIFFFLLGGLGSEAQPNMRVFFFCESQQQPSSGPYSLSVQTHHTLSLARTPAKPRPPWSTPPSVPSFQGNVLRDVLLCTHRARGVAVHTKYDRGFLLVVPAAVRGP